MDSIYLIQDNNDNVISATLEENIAIQICSGIRKWSYRNIPVCKSFEIFVSVINPKKKEVSVCPFCGNSHTEHIHNQYFCHYCCEEFSKTQKY
jgi:hypothetical protein